MQVTIGDLQVVALLEALAAAVLCVAAIFQSPPLLLQPHDFFARAPVQALVQLAHGKRHQELVANQLVAVSTADRAAVAAGVAARAAGAFISQIAVVVQGSVVVRESGRESRGRRSDRVRAMIRRAAVAVAGPGRRAMMDVVMVAVQRLLVDVQRLQVLQVIVIHRVRWVVGI